MTDLSYSCFSPSRDQTATVWPRAPGEQTGVGHESRCWHKLSGVTPALSCTSKIYKARSSKGSEVISQGKGKGQSPGMCQV